MSRHKNLPNGWKRGALDSICDLKAGKFVPASEISEYCDNSPYPCYGGNGLRGYVKEFSHRGTFPLIGRQGALCGNINKASGEFHATEHAVVATPNPNIEVNWLYYQLVNANLNKYATGAAQPGLSVKNIKEILFIVPPLPEQKAIADFLSTWDKAIKKTERLLQAKKKQKLSELHSLISSHKANSTIGSFAKPVVRKVDKPDESYIAVGIRSHFKGTFQRVVEDPKTIKMDSLYRVKKNDLIINITFAWEGAIALVKQEDEQCYVSHRFPTYEIKRTKAEPNFIRQLIMSSRMKYDLSGISPGGAGRNRVLNKKDFLKMPIWLPDLETQKNISEYLETIDKEINLLKQLAEKHKTQKRGLMQKVLTGEWRIKPEVVKRYA
ncbi:type I restriction enzyme, S subunit [Candidatus Electrothrix aarhusensis]|uniref:Type I restriction enzyme, S subunit n=1 Tax=Candidatus Electrothrix aarhusensis TaxID=1859131 RepID=A0A3S3U8D4_9BACT|nr:type I restriction enzyme, S subunit [Candidatus Electrothrix aarhusensis]